jgi:hypothetical protein
MSSHKIGQFRNGPAPLRHRIESLYFQAAGCARSLLNAWQAAKPVLDAFSSLDSAIAVLNMKIWKKYKPDWKD